MCRVGCCWLCFLSELLLLIPSSWLEAVVSGLSSKCERVGAVRILVGLTSASALVAGCLEIWARQLIRAFSFSDHLCASVAIHPTKLSFLALVVSVVVAAGALFVSRLNTTLPGSAVCSLLKIYCDWVKQCLLLFPGFQSICMDGQFKGNLASFSSPPEPWHVITSDCYFVLVDLTWSTFCVHIFRRQLQTNMAVRLCDVASLLRSGSWAPEPWTGVCGTSFFWHHSAKRPAFRLSAQAIPMMFAMS